GVIGPRGIIRTCFQLHPDVFIAHICWNLGVLEGFERGESFGCRLRARRQSNFLFEVVALFSIVAVVFPYGKLLGVWSVQRLRVPSSPERRIRRSAHRDQTCTARCRPRPRFLASEYSRD